MIKFADCTFTSVSSDESKFLEDFMTFASDFGGSSKERASLTELTVCGRTGNLTRPGQEVQAACTVIFKKNAFLVLRIKIPGDVPSLPPWAVWQRGLWAAPAPRQVSRQEKNSLLQ